MLNRIVLVGRLTRDPELKYTPDGVPVAQLGIAVNRITKNKDTGDYEVDFFNVVAWRRTAEFAQQYLTKGRLVSVDGRLQTRSWVDQATGQKRTAYEVVADSLEGLDRRGDAEAGIDVGTPPEAVAATPVAAASGRSSAPAATTVGKAGRNAPTPQPDDDLDESDPFADE